MDQKSHAERLAILGIPLSGMYLSRWLCMVLMKNKINTYIYVSNIYVDRGIMNS